jgi:hypothetical protein
MDWIDLAQNVDEWRALMNTVINVAIFWDTVLCNLFVNRHFGGTCNLYLQGRKSAEPLFPCSADFRP